MPATDGPGIINSPVNLGYLSFPLLLIWLGYNPLCRTAFWGAVNNSTGFLTAELTSEVYAQGCPLMSSSCSPVPTWGQGVFQPRDPCAALVGEFGCPGAGFHSAGFSSDLLRCTRDCAGLETSWWPGLISPHLGDMAHEYVKAMLWQFLLCPQCLSQWDTHTTGRLAVWKNVCVVFQCLCHPCTHKRQVFWYGSPNRCFVSLDFKLQFLLMFWSLMEIWNPTRHKSAPLGPLNVFVVLSFI